MASVHIFNACNEQITLEINGGPPLAIPPTGETSNWVPQQPKTAVPWGERDQIVGGFHYGTNKIRMYRKDQDRVGCQEPAIEIPTGGAAIDSLQFYLFWHSGKDLAWLFLSEGRPIAVSNTMLTAVVGL